MHAGQTDTPYYKSVKDVLKIDEWSFTKQKSVDGNEYNNDFFYTIYLLQMEAFQQASMKQ